MGNNSPAVGGHGGGGGSLRPQDSLASTMDIGNYRSMIILTVNRGGRGGQGREMNFFRMEKEGKN